VFTLFVIDATATTAMIVVIFSVILTFLPINFLHPVRVKRLRPLNLGICLIWCALGGYSLLMHFQSPDWVVWGVVISGIYLYCIGGILQLFPDLGK
jgi:phosphatidylcholine synthase